MLHLQYHSKKMFLQGFVGDSFDECQVWLFADADFARENDAKSTGCATVIVGPNTYFPPNAFSRKQTVTSMSSTEAEVVAANQSMRVEGIPILALFEQLKIFRQDGDTARGDAVPQIVQKGILAKIDREIDEIRNGNVESGISVADITGLVAHFPEFYRIKVMEDNQATITIMANGKSQGMTHAFRTQPVSFRWLKQQFELGQFDLVNINTHCQVADILTKPFTQPMKWSHAQRLLSVQPAWKPAAAPEKAAPCADADNDPGDGDPRRQGGGEIDRMLIEVCCSDTSKLGQLRDASQGCNMLRVTESHDLRKASTIEHVVKEVRKFRRTCPEGRLLVYASLPCTGGSPWGNVNKETHGGKARIKEQQTLYVELQNAFIRLVERIRDERTFIAYELSARCEYWSWRCVSNMCTWYGLQRFTFHGCQLGLVNRHGQPLLKAWTIATDMLELSILEDFKCTREHQHAQSRGKDLKDAENYTYEFTDLIHRCFEGSARGDACAMALLLSDEDHEVMEQNAQVWDDEMRSLFLAETWKESAIIRPRRSTQRGCSMTTLRRCAWAQSATKSAQCRT